MLSLLQVVVVWSCALVWQPIRMIATWHQLLDFYWPVMVIGNQSSNTLYIYTVCILHMYIYIYIYHIIWSHKHRYVQWHICYTSLKSSWLWYMVFVVQVRPLQHGSHFVQKQASNLCPPIATGFSSIFGVYLETLSKQESWCWCWFTNIRWVKSSASLPESSRQCVLFRFLNNLFSADPQDIGEFLNQISPRCFLAEAEARPWRVFQPVKPLSWVAV